MSKNTMGALFTAIDKLPPMQPDADWIIVLYNQICDTTFEHYIGFPERVKDYA